MTLNLVKLAVGVSSIAHMARLQQARRQQRVEAGGPDRVQHVTRNFPKRAEEILDGGSLYWVIKGSIRARQRILAFDRVAGRSGRPRCAIVLDPEIIATTPKPHRAIQGWRYFPDDEAPPDLQGGAGDLEGMSPEMADELQRLGLL